MAETNTQPRNLEAIILGTGEFSFSPGAVSAADAQSKGYRDFGNIVTIGFKPEIEIIEHEGSYRGIRRVDKRLATKGLLGYGLKCDELTRDNLRIALGGKDAPALTQAAKSLAAGDVLAFSANPATLNRWYDVLIAATRVRELTSLLVAKTAPKSCVADATLDTLTDNAHGLANGAPVILGGTAVPAGLVAGTVYYVVSGATNTFKVAATVGGPAIDLTSAGTAVTYQALLAEGVDYIADKKLGRVRFLTAQATDRFPVITAPAINVGDTASLLGLTPLDSLLQSGFGRIVLFDDTHPNKVVYDHADFSCQVSFESGTEMDGKKVAEIDFKILVTDTIGTVYTAE